MTSSKIKIVDDIDLRSKLVKIIKTTDKEFLLDYAIEIINIVSKDNDLKKLNTETTNSAIPFFLKWRKSEVSLRILRDQIFKLHTLARTEKNEITTSYYRFLAHALATAHVVDHLEVALDYLIKMVNLKTNFNQQESTNKRLFQISSLEKIISQNKRFE